MKFTDKALELMKRFSQGVGCPDWDEDTIEETMFYKYCKRIAVEKKKRKINEEVVKEYILLDHNPVVVNKGKEENSDIKAIKYCMVKPIKKDETWFALHGKNILFPITEDEVELLKEEIERLLKGL